MIKGFDCAVNRHCEGRGDGPNMESGAECGGSGDAHIVSVLQCLLYLRWIMKGRKERLGGGYETEDRERESGE